MRVFHVSIQRGGRAMATIFLSYRRQDTAGIAGRIYDRLRDHFGRDSIFMDVDAIPFGVDFREHINAEVGRCDLVLALIGPKWIGKTGRRRRIDEPRDLVRIELEAALARNLPVIPVLVDRADMPDESDLPLSLAVLAYRNAVAVDQGRDFHPHVDRLIRGMEYLLAQPRPTAGAPSIRTDSSAPTAPPTEEPGRPAASGDFPKAVTQPRAAEPNSLVRFDNVGGITVVRFLKCVHTEMETLEVFKEIGGRVDLQRDTLFDLTELTFAGSVALSQFFLLNKRFRTSGGCLRLFGISPEVLQLFQTSLLIRIFTIHPDEASALEAARHGHRPEGAGGANAAPDSPPAAPGSTGR
jgi:anti-anti-sigma regulatory factor